jgi:hypothetical protein
MSRFSRADEDEMQLALEKIIGDWFDRAAAEKKNMPNIGGNVPNMMAAAALAVLLAVADTEDHLRDEDLLKEAD